MQVVCNKFECAVAFSQDRQSAQKHRVKAQKKEHREAVKEVREKSLSWWVSVGADSNKNGGNTAHWLHQWVRNVRDKDSPCIMCGKDESNAWHACHYRSRGAAKQLRFEPDNIWKGCAHCNVYTKGDTGANYRANLVLRIGEDRVQELDSDNRIYRWTIEECRQIRDHYRDLVKEWIKK
ncbi:recombination protein NinG [Porticoccaceae bacterium]|nr:recombination protein NinG [Porticoccaceae bacterium]